MYHSSAKVSIIVPIYNVEDYLPTCLESCSKQKLRDLEVICVNDGSKDGSQKIIESFAANDSRFLVINQENRGLSSARNAGIKAANGNVIMFLDSDDYLSENASERIWIEWLEAPTDIIVFNTNVFPEIPKADKYFYDKLTRIPTKRINRFTPEVLFKEDGAKPFVWRQAFSKDFLDRYQLLFDESVKFGEDMVFQMEVFPHAEHFAFISDILYNYRWYREGSLMSIANADLNTKIGKHMYILDQITSYWQKQGWIDQFGGWLYNWILEFTCHDIQQLPKECAEEHYRHLADIIRRFHLQEAWGKSLTPYNSQIARKIERI